MDDLLRLLGVLTLIIGGITAVCSYIWLIGSQIATNNELKELNKRDNYYSLSSRITEMRVELSVLTSRVSAAEKAIRENAKAQAPVDGVQPGA